GLRRVAGARKRVCRALGIGHGPDGRPRRPGGDISDAGPPAGPRADGQGLRGLHRGRIDPLALQGPAPDGHDEADGDPRRCARLHRGPGGEDVRGPDRTCGPDDRAGNPGRLRGAIAVEMVVGFVGLGAMGGEMVRRLLAAGRKIVGYNRTRSKAQPLLDAGMGWRDSPRAVAEAATVIFTMVADTAALHAVTEGPGGILAGLGPGKIYVDMSTVSPAASKELAARVAERGARMLDAPVSGSTVTVREGKLSFMVGGDRATCEAVTPVLLDIGPRVTYVGGHGQGALMKIATNLNLAVQMLAFSEGLLLAEKGGIPRQAAAEVLLNSAIASPMLRYRGPFVL